MPSKNAKKHPAPTRARLRLEIKKNNLEYSYHEQQCRIRAQRNQVLVWKEHMYDCLVRRKVYGPGRRQKLIAMACIRFEREQKRYPGLTLNDLKDILWCKYTFYLKEGSKKKISYQTLRSDVDKAHAMMNLPIEMLEGSRSHIKRAFSDFKTIQRKCGKMLILTLFSEILPEIDLVIRCACA